MDPLIASNWSSIRETVNTPNMVTESVELSSSRTFTDYIDANNKALAHRLGSNPILSIAFTGKIYALAGLAIATVGSAITDLPNFTDLATGVTWRGHDPDDGTITLKDAKDTLPGGADMIATSLTFEHNPFLE